jgi:hypothetical protein
MTIPVHEQKHFEEIFLVTAVRFATDHDVSGAVP